MTQLDDQQPAEPSNPPAFNVPATIACLIVLLVGIHALRTLMLDKEGDIWVLLNFAFFPASYSVGTGYPIEPLAKFWSPVSHGLLHGDWTHLLINSVWLLAFGSAVARRFKTTRFLVFMALATAAGALAHFMFHSTANIPVIGASGAVSACMGAAVRFAFTPGRSLDDAANAPALSLMQSLMNRGIMTFVVIWFVLNWVFGAGGSFFGVEANIAWEAHMGGFIFGWLAFAAFDPRRSS